MNTQQFPLPENLPTPIDDGSCDHLKTGDEFPMEIFKSLPTTSGRQVETKNAKRIVLYFYPRSGVPQQKLPDGWDQIPGARGCTPQSCAMRDHFEELRSFGVNVFGCSTQTTDFQREFSQRIHLPFDLISDSKLELLNALKLPSFTVAELGETPLIKRLTIILRNDRIEKVFYPIFPPDQHAEQILQWIKSNPIDG